MRGVEITVGPTGRTDRLSPTGAGHSLSAALPSPAEGCPIFSRFTPPTVTLVRPFSSPSLSCLSSTASFAFSDPVLIVLSPGGPYGAPEYCQSCFVAPVTGCCPSPQICSLSLTVHCKQSKFPLTLRQGCSWIEIKGAGFRVTQQKWQKLFH